jgi:hypothetical protein
MKLPFGCDLGTAVNTVAEMPPITSKPEHPVSRWYAAYTCPRHEKYVARQLDERSIARENGALGGKIMGAGGGGFFMFCCPNGHKSKLRKTMSMAGLREVGYDFDFDGSKVLANF